MKIQKKFLLFIGIFCFLQIFKTQELDSLVIHIFPGRNAGEYKVHQIFYPKSPVEKICLSSLIFDFQNKKSDLVYRRLEERERSLYFANTQSRGSLELNGKPLSQPLCLSSQTDYTEILYYLRLPDPNLIQKADGQAEYTLSDFLLKPIGKIQNNPVKINLTIDPGLVKNIVQTNLSFNGKSYNGKSFSIPPIYFTQDDNVVQVEDSFHNTYVFEKLSDKIDKNEMHLQIERITKFIHTYFPQQGQTYFFSKEWQNKNKFVGIDDIGFKKLKIKRFPDTFKSDIQLFHWISQKWTQAALPVEKEILHYVPNGLATFLEMEYCKKYYPEITLLGNLTEMVHLGKWYPLHHFEASKTSILARYPMAYAFIASRNLDQKITTPYSKLSLYNATAISSYYTALWFEILHANAHPDTIKLFTQELSFLAQNTALTSELFQRKILTYFPKNTALFKEKLNSKIPWDLSIKTKTKKDSFQILVHNNAENTAQISWYQDKKQLPTTIEVPPGTHPIGVPENIRPKKNIVFSLNDPILNPELFQQNNSIIGGRNTILLKKIRLVPYQDFPKKGYYDIYYQPRISANAYDKVLLGINFSNKGVFRQPFVFSATPYYSTGSKNLAYSTGLSYTFYPREDNAKIREYSFGASSRYFQYDTGLNYRQQGFSANLQFHKPPRSAINKSLYAGYSIFNRDLPANSPSHAYSQYNLWRVGYSYGDGFIIREKYYNTSLSGMEDFIKLSAETLQRWEIADRKRISLRLFAGIFLQNKTRSTLFNIGISRVGDYTYSSGLLGSSSTEGIFSQQYVLADIGMKSRFYGSVGSAAFSANGEYPILRFLHVYADAAAVKNKNRDFKFIYDSGVKLTIIRDNFEIYFPIMSSLGWEPGFTDYATRIRFSITLNLSAITGQLQRGYF